MAMEAQSPSLAMECTSDGNLQSFEMQGNTLRFLNEEGGNCIHRWMDAQQIVVQNAEYSPSDASITVVLAKKIGWFTYERVLVLNNCGD